MSEWIISALVIKLFLPEGWSSKENKYQNRRESIILTMLLRCCKYLVFLLRYSYFTFTVWFWSVIPCKQWISWLMNIAIRLWSEYMIKEKHLTHYSAVLYITFVWKCACTQFKLLDSVYNLDFVLYVALWKPWMSCLSQVIWCNLDMLCWKKAAKQSNMKHSTCSVSRVWLI